MKQLIAIAGVACFAGHVSGQEISIDQMTQLWGQAQQYCEKRYGTEDRDMLNECTEMRARVTAKQLHPKVSVSEVKQTPTERNTRRRFVGSCDSAFRGDPQLIGDCNKYAAWMSPSKGRTCSEIFSNSSEIIDRCEQYGEASATDQQSAEEKRREDVNQQFLKNREKMAAARSAAASGQESRHGVGRQNTAAGFLKVLQELNFNLCVGRGGTPITSPGGMVTCREKRPQTTTCRGGGYNTVNCTTY